ncbi:kinase-like domain-containing protein [Cyathus striatus]|nr:kinase-like domain-containing protein [Cyathus striatus]
MQISVKKKTAQLLRETADLRDPIVESFQPPLSHVEQYIIRQAELLGHSPDAVLSAQGICPKGYRLEYPSTQGDHLRYFILVSPNHSRILSITNTPVPSPNYTDHIRSRVGILDLKATPYYEDSSWLNCLSQLVQIELDRFILNVIEHQNAFRLLRELTLENILPCSLFIDVKEEGRYPVNCHGASSDIYKGQLNGVSVCVKVLRHRFDQKAYKQFVREGVVWRQLKHPNIMQCLGISKSFLGNHVSLISYWMKNGNVMEFLEKNPRHERLDFIRQIASAIQYLHGHQPPIVHRDIKGVNIMVNDEGICCLADFGLVSLLETQRSTDCGFGTLYWLAPERIDPERFPDEQSGCPADIYSFAWTIIEICCGSHPFHREAPAAFFLPIDNGIWDIVEACWCQQPKQRLEIGKVVEKLSFLSPVAYPVTSTNESIVHMKMDVTSSNLSAVSLPHPYPIGILTPPITPLALRAPTPHMSYDSNPMSPINLNILEPVPRPQTPIRALLNRVHPVGLPTPPITPFQGNSTIYPTAYNHQGSSIQAGLEQHR